MKSIFERDFVQVRDHFPHLTYEWNTEHKTWCVTGELDICDTEGVYWNTFGIVLLVPESYPHCIPVLIEKTEIIPRDIDWHVSPEGICCMDIGHNLIILSKKGINLTDFITNKVYSFFANQLYKLEKQCYAGEEYGHHLQGVMQYYKEELNLLTPDIMVTFITRILNKSGIGRNAQCPCGSGKKVKKCHLITIEALKLLGSKKISTDLENINEYLKSDKDIVSCH